MINELLSKLEERDKNTERVTFAFKDAQFVGGPSNALSIGSDSYDLTDKSFKSLCDVLGIPKPFAKKLDIEGKNKIFNHLISRQKDYSSFLFTDKKVRSFMDTSFPYVSTYKVVDAELSQHEGEFEVGNYRLDDDVLEYIAFTPEMDQTIIDSPVRGGLRTLHSDSWKVFPRFDTYIYRVICTNGAISPLSHKKFRVSGKSEFEILDQVRSFTQQSLEQIPQMFEGFLLLEKTEVDNAAHLIRRICSENKLPKKVADLLIESMENPWYQETVRGPIQSMYDVVNLITWVASHNSDELTESVREHLFAIGGNLMLHQSTRCNSCGGVVE